MNIIAVLLSTANRRFRGDLKKKTVSFSNTCDGDDRRRVRGDDARLGTRVQGGEQGDDGGADRAGEQEKDKEEEEEGQEGGRERGQRGRGV